MTAERLFPRSAYGALELKQSYQRGLVSALATAVLLHVGAFLWAGLYLRHLEEHMPIPLPPIPHLTEHTVSPPLRMEEPPPPGPPGGAKPDFVQGKILPMPDELVRDESLFATRQDLSNFWNGLFDSADGRRGLPGRTGVESIDPAMITPSPDSFIVRTREPKPLPGQPEPDYPEFALLSRSEGVVRLRVLVNEHGLVADVRVLNKPGSISEWLIEASIDAIRQWKFIPALQQDRAVPTWYDQAFYFQLSAR